MIKLDRLIFHEKVILSFTLLYKNMSQNLIMVDHAFKDCRSISAMLHSTDDGRALAWQSFEEKHPYLSQEELMEKFTIEARYGRIHIKNLHSIFSYKKFFAALISFFIIVA